MAKATIYLGFLALIAPYLYDRYLAFSGIFANRPSNMNSIYNVKSHKLKFRDRIRNCEDAIIEEGLGLAILSCDPGRDRWNTVMGTFARDKGHQSGGLWIYDYSNSELSDAEAIKPLTLENFDTSDFHPLGIEFDSSTSTLYVVNHPEPGSVIEIFSLSVTSATAAHVKTFKHPLVYSPNSIQTVGDGKFFVTNDHYLLSAISPFLSKIETFSGIPGGSVVYVDINKPENIKIVAHASFANGITKLNSTTLAVASTGKSAVYFYDITDEYGLTYKGYVRTPVPIDNISVDSQGTISMAGHPFAPSVMAVAKRRVDCYPDSDKEDEREACKCDAPSWAGQWSSQGGLKELYKGFEICSSSTAARDASRGIGIITGLYDRGIMVWRE